MAVVTLVISDEENDVTLKLESEPSMPSRDNPGTLAQQAAWEALYAATLFLTSLADGGDDTDPSAA